MTTTFTRDRFTWLAYLSLGFYAGTQATLGPIMPFLRDELNLSYTISGLHITAFALGMIIIGLWGNRLAERYGRAVAFWGGGFGMMLGAGLFMVGRHAVFTILSSFVMSVTGTLLLIMIQATLAEYHGKNRAVPLTESNIVASVLAGIAPLLVGFGAQTMFGWRTVMVCAIGYWLVLFAFYFRHTKIPPNRVVQNNSEKATGKLPKAFWAYWLVLFLGVGVEWCLAFWGATYLETVLDFAKDEAAYIMGLFLFAFVVARFGFSRLTRFYSVKLLLWVAIACTTVGFLGFWLLRVPYLNVVGLVVAGLGVANLFPLGLSLASDIGSEQANVASARISLAAGLAIFMMPQILGVLADQVGIQLAYSVVPILLLLVAITTFLANRVLQ